MPTVSVIVPAKNEEARIREVLIMLLQSTGIELEILAVNDRSTDNTGHIMEEVAAKDARLKVIHLSRLPEEWLGKSHAMHIAAQQATGELLLFTDGDIYFEPSAIATGERHFLRHELKHLCLMPRMIPGNIFESAVVTFFGLAYAVGMQLHLIRTRWPMSYAGVGAFNLVEAEFYHSLNGHKMIAMDILDDVKLGKMIKKNGGKSDFQFAPQLLSVRWQESLWGVVTGLEKNGFASLNYSVLQLFLLTSAVFLAMVFPYFSPFVLPLNESSGFLAAITLWHLLYAFMVWQIRGGFWAAILFPVGVVLLSFAYWRSAIITLWQGGVRWRESFYSLTQLRRGLYS